MKNPKQKKKKRFAFLVCSFSRVCAHYAPASVTAVNVGSVEKKEKKEDQRHARTRTLARARTQPPHVQSSSVDVIVAITASPVFSSIQETARGAPTF
jgi:hypothetical protein